MLWPNSSNKFETSDWIAEALAHHAPEAEVRLSLATDIASDGSFGERCVALCGDRLLVVAPNGGEAELQLELPIKEVKEVAIDNLVGGGMLQAVLENGCRIDLLPYTSALSTRAARFRTQLEAMVQDKPVPALQDEIHRCEKCGLVLGELTRVCPRCLRRGATLRRLLSYARPYRWQLGMIAVLMLLSTALMMVPPYFTKLLLGRRADSPQPAAAARADGRLGARRRLGQRLQRALAAA